MPPQRAQFWTTLEIFLVSFRRAHRSVGILRMRDEYVVAERVLPGNQVFLLPFAFGDFIVAFRVAAEDAARLPCRGQNLWGSDFQNVVEDVRAGKVKPLYN